MFMPLRCCGSVVDVLLSNFTRSVVRILTKSYNSDEK